MPKGAMPKEKKLLFKVRRNDGTHEWVICTNGETAGFPAFNLSGTQI